MMSVKKDSKYLGYVGSVPGKVSRNDWYTPEKYIRSARKVMGSIGLDPFSSEKANDRVKAAKFYTEADDALSLSWKGRTKNIWVNPPYSGGLAGKSVDKFLSEYAVGHFKQAVVLMNASTDTVWFHKMVKACNALCFTKGRISFESYDGKAQSGNTKGQVFFYFGHKYSEFKHEFTKYGVVFINSVNEVRA